MAKRDRRAYFGPWLACGAAGGVVGGLLMAAVAMILFPLFGFGSVWQPMTLIAAVVDPRWATIEGLALGPVLAGVVIHLITSALLGVLFAWLASGLGGQVVLNAVLAALLAWGAAQFVALPLWNPVMAVRFPMWLLALCHVFYGLGLGATLYWYLGAKVSPVEPPFPPTLRTAAR